NMERLQHFEAIQTTTLDDETPSGAGEPPGGGGQRPGIALVALALALPAAAQQWGGRPWHQLTPEEQQRAWQNYQRYQQLPEQRQRMIERRYQQFQALPPQAQQRLRQNKAA